VSHVLHVRLWTPAVGFLQPAAASAKGLPINPWVVLSIVGLVSVLVGTVRGLMVYSTAVKTTMASGSGVLPPGTIAESVVAGVGAARSTFLLGIVLGVAVELLPNAPLLE
jgi:hypothetical protein